MNTDTIEREIAIQAPVDRVWSLITQAEHLGTWFGEAGADIDLKPGGAIEVRWADHSLQGIVQTVEPTHLFAFRWRQLDVPAGTELSNGNSTLVEFLLDADGDTTRLRVVESGFDALRMSEDDRRGLHTGHTEGWGRELDELDEHAATVAA